MRKELAQRAGDVQALISEEAIKAREEAQGRIKAKPWWLPFRLWEFLLRELLVDFSKGGDTNARKNN